MGQPTDRDSDSTGFAAAVKAAVEEGAKLHQKRVKGQKDAAKAVQDMKALRDQQLVEDLLPWAAEVLTRLPEAMKEAAAKGRDYAEVHGETCWSYVRGSRRIRAIARALELMNLSLEVGEMPRYPQEGNSAMIVVYLPGCGTDWD